MSAPPDAAADPAAVDPAAADAVLIGFAEALRHAGTAVTADRTQTFLRAVASLDAGRTTDVYWAGRATLCSGPDDRDRFDAVFTAWFSGELPTGRTRRGQPPTSVRASLEDTGPGAEQRGEPLATSASTTEILRHRDIAEMSDAERAELTRLFGLLRVRPALRRSSRRRAARTGELDARRTLRAQLRHAGEPARVLRRRRRPRPRKVVLLIDVSGSMGPYADALLRLAHVLTRAAPATTEVFTIGTRLTHVTRAMRHRDPQRALATAAETVPDWSGGTRLGEALKVFLDRWGQRGAARRAVVVVCSDGWERGDAALLGEQAQRLSRLAHLVIWLNPHRGKLGYQPVQAGIAAALPYVDHLVAGHSLAAFDELLEVVAHA